MSRFISVTFLGAAFTVLLTNVAMSTVIDFHESFGWSQTAALATNDDSWVTHYGPPWYYRESIANGGYASDTSGRLELHQADDQHNSLQSVRVSSWDIMGAAAGTWFDTSTPLTISADVGYSGPAGWNEAGLIVGPLYFLYWPGTKDSEIYPVEGKVSAPDILGAADGSMIHESVTIVENGTNYDIHYSYGTWSRDLSLPIASIGVISGTGMASMGLAGTYSTFANFSVTQNVPEPGTLALLGCGAISLLAYAWRRRR
jgi:hypothetical protein